MPIGKNVYWETAFLYLNVNEKIYIFNKTVKNILSNFVPHETIMDHGDPSWINEKIKK